MNKHTWVADLGDGTYKNPILYADYSDPDAIRVGDDYFMIASSFSNAPGLPLLHSKDLVNWKVVNYIIEEIPDQRYEKPTHGCGVWAPAIRYHEGVFYACFPMPDEGIYMSTTKDPFGTWSKPINIRPGAGWIDPCPFWDDDGNAYLVAGVARSRIGYKSVLHLVRMKPDGTGIFGEEVRIFDGNLNDQETIEGPKMYKRNGYYYIFAPAGGVKTGWQTVLRSKKIWGPYEYKVVMRQGNTPINGPHQGAWVDTVTGEDWFLHFQDVYAAGRITHLQPMTWVNDWPVIGAYVEGTDYGVPVTTYQKPKVGGIYEITAPEESDDFSKETLGLQWQWNANPKKDWYELNPKKQELHLRAVYDQGVNVISELPNLLLQKWPAPEFTCEMKMDLSHMEVGDSAGIVSMGITFGGILCTRKENGFVIEQILGTQEFVKEKAFATQNRVICEETNQSEICFRYEVRRMGIRESAETTDAPQEKIYLSYRLDGEQFKPAVDFKAQAGRWVGVKLGMVCTTSCETTAGYAVAEYVRFMV
ncbi:MAG: glycoside hydrolase 43 family protein [Clostridiales bacterium]|nr:glycoside hydrolase 43 family protein [Clostridiales bacterium]